MKAFKGILLIGAVLSPIILGITLFKFGYEVGVWIIVGYLFIGAATIGSAKK